MAKGRTRVLNRLRNQGAISTRTFNERRTGRATTTGGVLASVRQARTRAGRTGRRRG